MGGYIFIIFTWLELLGPSISWLKKSIFAGAIVPNFHKNYVKIILFRSRTKYFCWSHTLSNTTNKQKLGKILKINGQADQCRLF